MTIRRVKGGYRLVSGSGKNLGTYRSKAGAQKREKQVNYFKNVKKKNERQEGDLLYTVRNSIHHRVCGGHVDSQCFTTQVVVRLMITCYQCGETKEESQTLSGYCEDCADVWWQEPPLPKIKPKDGRLFDPNDKRVAKANDS